MRALAERLEFAIEETEAASRLCALRMCHRPCEKSV
jgi:hypothetical protein